MKQLLAGMTKHPTLVACLLILVFFVSALASMVKKTSTYDEAGNLEFGRRVLVDETVEASMQRMAITALNAVPVLLLEKCGYSLSDRQKIFVSRIPTILLAAVLGFFVFLWSSRLYGAGPGLFSLVLFTFSPNILALSRFVTNDMYATAFIFLATYSFTGYLKHPSWKRLVPSACCFGGAQLAKQTALLLFPLFGVLFFLSCFLPRPSPDECREEATRPGIGMTVLHGVVFLAITIVIINLGYRFKGVSLTYLIPLPKTYTDAIAKGMQYNALGIGHGLIYVLGQRSQQAFWYYYLIALAVKIPLAALLLAAFSAVLLKKHFAGNPLDEITLLVVPFVLLFFFSFFCTAQIGIRYLLPMLPFVYVAMGKIVTHEPGRYARLYRMGVSFLLLWFVISSASFYPHYLSYCNEVVGRRMNLYKVLADSNVDWGQNDRYLDEYVKNHPEKERIFVKPHGPVDDGLVIVTVNELVGIDPWCPDKYAWLRDHHKPIGHIAYSWLIYRIPPPNKNPRSLSE